MPKAVQTHRVKYITETIEFGEIVHLTKEGIYLSVTRKLDPGDRTLRGNVVDKPNVTAGIREVQTDNDSR